jgi:hypothetical protein
MEKPITIKLEMAGGVGGVVPQGERECMRWLIYNGYALIKFNNCKYTKEFALKNKVLSAEYIERMQVCKLYYFGMKQLEIAEKIKKDIEKAQNG